MKEMAIKTDFTWNSRNIIETSYLVSSAERGDVEALTAECVLACDRAGVLEEVLGSLGAEWPALADYRLDRMMVHGVRRAAEMEESAKTLEALGIAPLMTRGTIARQRQIGSLGLVPAEGLESKLSALRVTPAKSGVHAGQTESGADGTMDSRLRGNDKEGTE